MFAAVADEQIVRGAAATLSWQGVDQHGEPADPGTVTATVTKSDGTAVLTDASTSGSGTDPRTVALSVSQTAVCDRLTVAWSSGGVQVGSTVVDVVGGYLISSVEFQQLEPKSVAGFDSAKFRRARREVDDLFRRVCGRSFVPRVDVERVTPPWATRRLPLRYPQLQRVAWATDEDGTAVTGATGASPSESGIAELDDHCWPAERITVAYEHGYLRPPVDIVGAAARVIRDKMSQPSSSIPDRATSFADPSGGTMNLATPGLGPFITGIPEVDEVLRAHRWNSPAVA